MARTKATRYAGGNERLDNLLLNFPDDEVWIVEGVNGRVLYVGTEEEVLERYNNIPSKWK